jgi:transposase
VCVLDADGVVIERAKVGCSPEAVAKFFACHRGVLVAMETGTHSRWVSRMAEAAGLSVLVGNARKLRAIWASKQKSDVRDAEMLARIARLDPTLLCPIQHRSEKTQALLSMIQARDQLVCARGALISHVRGVVKGFGARVNKCSTESFHSKAQLPDVLRDALVPVLSMIEKHTETIRNYDRRIEEQVAKNPDAQRLMQVPGVGPLIALAFILTIEEAGRFEKSRTVGAFVGLAPRRDQSGASDKQLHITKEGNTYLRRLLVTAAHRILGPFGPDCDLRSHGLRIAERGGKNAKKRAVVAVARKLAVLLHALWKNATDYQPRHTLAQAA